MVTNRGRRARYVKFDNKYTGVVCSDEMESDKLDMDNYQAEPTSPPESPPEEPVTMETRQTDNINVSAGRGQVDVPYHKPLPNTPQGPQQISARAK